MTEIAKGWLRNRTLLVVDTDHPVTHHFSDNLCAFCTGFGGPNTAKLWAEPFFTEMSIDPNAAITLKNGKPEYPNPFKKLIWPTMTAEKKFVHSTPWSNPRYGYNGLYEYIDQTQQTSLSGRLIGPSELPQYNKPAIMSVAVFFSAELHSLLFEIFKARTESFCRQYPNSINGKYHKVEAFRYEKAS